MDERTRKEKENGQGAGTFGQQQRERLWEELKRRAGSVVTDKYGVASYVTQAPHELRQYLHRTDPSKEVVSFIDIEVLAKSQTAGQLPKVILPTPVPETLNINEIARVERITSPFLEAEFIGVPVSETESFRTLETSGSREREMVAAGR